MLEQILEGVRSIQRATQPAMSVALQSSPGSGKTELYSNVLQAFLEKHMPPQPLTLDEMVREWKAEKAAEPDGGPAVSEGSG